MEHLERKEIYRLFEEAVRKPSYVIEEGNPCILIHNGVRYNIFLRSLSPAQLSNNNPDIWRAQLPKRPIFEDIKADKDLFIFLGYDAANDVYATWNPYWIKQRLNVGESISLYSRYSLQQEAANKNDFICRDLSKGLVVLFPRMMFLDYLDNLSKFFPEETTYVAVGSSLRKNKKSNTMTKADILLNSEIVEELKSLLASDEPNELEALQLISDNLGDAYKDTMQFSDWLQLIRSIDWKTLSQDDEITNESPTQQEHSSEEEIRKAFWDHFYDFQNERNGIYKDCTTSHLGWYASRYAYGASVTSLLFNKKVRVEVYWNKWEDARNKEIFDSIVIHKADIEEQLGFPVDWQRLDAKNACRISITRPYSYKDKKEHHLIAELFTVVSRKFWEVLIPYFQNIPTSIELQTPLVVQATSDEDICKLFQDYLRRQGKSENSIRKYSLHVAHNTGVKEIIKNITGQDSLFEILSIDDVAKVRAEVKTSPFDIKGGSMYSVGLSHYINFLVAWNEQHTPEEEPEPSDVKVRRSNLNFYEMGLSQGDILSWIDDPNITVEVIAPKKVLYQGQPYSLSTLSAILKGYNAKHISPCPYWLYKGKNLSDIYVATYSEPEKPDQEAEEIRKKKDPSDAVVLFDHAVDYSFFNYGCTLDKKFHQTIFDVLGGRIERGQRQDIVLIYDGKEFAAQFENVDRHGVKSDTIRLMWKGKADAKLSAYLQQKFPEYKTIADLHDRHEHVPENLLHTAFLYKDDCFTLKIE